MAAVIARGPFRVPTGAAIHVFSVLTRSSPTSIKLLRLDGGSRPGRPERRKIDEVIKVAPGHRRHLSPSLLPVTDRLRVTPMTLARNRLARLQLDADCPNLRRSVVSWSEIELPSPNRVKACGRLAGRVSFHKFVDSGARLRNQRGQSFIFLKFLGLGRIFALVRSFTAILRASFVTTPSNRRRVLPARSRRPC